MPVMTVHNEDQHDPGGDHRFRPRWSAGKKTDAVLRLLRGEPLEVLSRELGIEAHRLAAWRDEFLEAGKQGLKGQRADRSPDDRQLKEAERKVGQLTLESGTASVPTDRPTGSEGGSGPVLRNRVICPGSRGIRGRAAI